MIDLEVKGLVYLILAFLATLFVLGLILFFTVPFIIFSTIVCIAVLVILAISIIIGILILIFAVPYYAVTKPSTIMAGDYTLEQIRDEEDSRNSEGKGGM